MCVCVCVCVCVCEREEIYIIIRIFSSSSLLSGRKPRGKIGEITELYIKLHTYTYIKPFEQNRRS